MKAKNPAQRGEAARLSDAGRQTLLETGIILDDDEDQDPAADLILREILRSSTFSSRQYHRPDLPWNYPVVRQ